MEIQTIFKDLPTLETERLLLRKITLEDADDMFEYASNEVVSEYLSWEAHKSIDDSLQFIKFVLERYKKGEVAPWGIEYKKNGKFIGTINFVSWLPNDKVAEIGYAISKDYWGKGITTEAAKEVISFGFHNMDLVRIQARCDVKNIASARVLEKNGMIFEGVMRKVVYFKGRHRDLKMYSILREEFFNSQ